MYPEKKVKMFGYLLMLIMLSSCYSVKPLYQPIDNAISKEKPQKIKLVLNDDSKVILHDPKVIDDKIIGMSILPGTDSTTSDTLQQIIPLEHIKKGYQFSNKVPADKIIVAGLCTAVAVLILSKKRTHKGFTAAFSKYD